MNHYVVLQDHVGRYSVTAGTIFTSAERNPDELLADGVLIYQIPDDALEAARKSIYDAVSSRNTLGAVAENDIVAALLTAGAIGGGNGTVPGLENQLFTSNGLGGIVGTNAFVFSTTLGTAMLVQSPDITAADVSYNLLDSNEQTQLSLRYIESTGKHELVAAGPLGVNSALVVPVGTGSPYALPSEDGAEGGVLTTDGQGNVSFEPVAQAALSVFPLALAQDQQTIWNGPGGGAGDMEGAFVYSQEAGTLTTMGCWVSQIGGQDGDVTLAIYSEQFQRLAVTESGKPTQPGLLELDLTAPFEFTPGQIFFFAIHTNRNGEQYLRVTGRYRQAGPAIAWEFPNSGFPPLDASSAASNKQNDRYWVFGR